MKRSLVVLLVMALLGGVVLSFSASAPAVAGRSRCNASNAGDFDNQVREDSKRPPGPKERAQRFSELDHLLSDIQMEQSALVASCDKESDRLPIDSQLRATAGWALVQQADIAQAQLAQACPAAKDAETSRLLAAAWYELAKGIPEGQAVPPKSVAAIVPFVQTRAAAVKLALPAYAETSTYWRDQIADQAKTAVAACPK